MKIEIKPPVVPPEVIVTLSVKEARHLHNRIYSIMDHKSNEDAILRLLVTMLTDRGVQLPEYNEP